METWYKKAAPNVQVKAVRVNEENAADVAKWCRGTIINEIDPEFPDETRPGINVPTIGGHISRASLGMYVIEFAKTFVVHHNRVFEEKYAPLDRPAPPPESIGDSRKARGFADPFGPSGKAHI